MRYPPLYGKNIKQKKRKKVKKKRRIATLEEKKVVRWVVDNKKNWERKEEVEANHRKIEEIVPQKFLKWKRMFGKVKSEKMLIKKSGIMPSISRRYSNLEKEGSTLYLKMKRKKSRNSWKIN